MLFLLGATRQQQSYCVMFFIYGCFLSKYLKSFLEILKIALRSLIPNLCLCLLTSTLL